MLNGRASISQRRSRGDVAVVVRRKSVHATSADESTLASLETEIREQVGGRHRDGSVVRSSSCPVGEGAFDDLAVDFFGFGSIGEAAFHGEGVGVEPVKEGTLAEDARIWVLGGVDVGI